MIGLPGLRNRKVVAQRSAGELDAMAAAGSLVAAALLAVRQAASPGVSTLALDEIAEAVIRDGGGTPSFLGYHGFPASICASVNDRVVHGIPSAAETLAPGDLVSIDCGAILDGWHGDSAITFGVGTRTVSGAGVGAGHRAHAHPRHHQDRCAGRRMDRRHRRRVACGALGAHRRGHRRRAANSHAVALTGDIRRTWITGTPP